ncbi:hypothetical protein L2E82_29670 [Cichorium intybus]|uniref:Uncharacterized protein n=1 Tax=Cichorium intybus TaxID=13427 RepID=A0ACB9CYE1_CICIN|nr:hypothetical protein L2E82_29670 [Cichorium intybus]
MLCYSSHRRFPTLHHSTLICSNDIDHLDPPCISLMKTQVINLRSKNPSCNPPPLLFSSHSRHSPNQWRNTLSGLIVTDAIIYWTLKFLRFAVHIREVYMLTAPFFASNTMIVAYFFGKELWNSGAGLVTAALTAICSEYISRSVAVLMRFFSMSTTKPT